MTSAIDLPNHIFLLEVVTCLVISITCFLGVGAAQVADFFVTKTKCRHETKLRHSNHLIAAFFLEERGRKGLFGQHFQFGMLIAFKVGNLPVVVTNG